VGQATCSVDGVVRCRPPETATKRFGKLLLESREGWCIDAPHGIGQGFNDAHIVDRLIVDLARVRQLEADTLSGGLYALVGGTSTFGRRHIEAGERDLRTASGGGGCRWLISECGNGGESEQRAQGSRAEGGLRADRWNAGAALMQAQRPQAWRALMDAGKLTKDNS
jgi:hypothetical protein